MGLPMDVSIHEALWRPQPLRSQFRARHVKPAAFCWWGALSQQNDESGLDCAPGSGRSETTGGGANAPVLMPQGIGPYPYIWR